MVSLRQQHRLRLWVRDFVCKSHDEEQTCPPVPQHQFVQYYIISGQRLCVHQRMQVHRSRMWSGCEVQHSIVGVPLKADGQYGEIVCGASICYGGLP